MISRAPAFDIVCTRLRCRLHPPKMSRALALDIVCARPSYCLHPPVRSRAPASLNIARTRPKYRLHSPLVALDVACTRPHLRCREHPPMIPHSIPCCLPRSFRCSLPYHCTIYGQGCHLPFTALHQLGVCISQGVLIENNIASEFLWQAISAIENTPVPEQPSC